MKSTFELSCEYFWTLSVLRNSVMVYIKTLFCVLGILWCVCTLEILKENFGILLSLLELSVFVKFYSSYFETLYMMYYMALEDEFNSKIGSFSISEKKRIIKKVRNMFSIYKHSIAIKTKSFFLTISLVYYFCIQYYWTLFHISTL